MKSCCVTGHRDIAVDKISLVERKLRKEIITAISDGYTDFFSGFAPGVDILFGKLVVELQKKHPKITLNAALPYPTWMKYRRMEEQKLLTHCVSIGVHSPKYNPNCFLVRNHFMINSCERLIAVYDGRTKGGTVNTMRYAAALKRDIRNINI